VKTLKFLQYRIAAAKNQAVTGAAGGACQFVKKLAQFLKGCYG
jgi:hypothetical protein